LTLQQAKVLFKSILEKETENLMGLDFECQCGKRHTIPIKYLTVNHAALDELKAQLYTLNINGTASVIYDRIIENRVVKNILQNLEDQGILFFTHPVGDGKNKPDPEVQLAKEIAKGIGKRADFLISVGSGVISDLTKYAAFELSVPFILIPTAPSMNGYTSSMAALTDRGIKNTLLVSPARAIFADLDILMEAPVEMVLSGLGDIVSKSVCNADWKLSQMIKGTYFCPLPFLITDKTEPLYLKAVQDIGKRSEYGIKILTDGVMRSGLSMTVIGTSTPSSGSEHLLSHYWDLISLMNNTCGHFHGTQVGVATIIILKLYDFIRTYPVGKISLSGLEKNYPEKGKVEAYIDTRYGCYANGIKNEFLKKYMPWKDKKKEIDRILQMWENLWKELDPYLRPWEPVEKALRESGAAFHYQDIGKERNEVVDALLHAYLIRARYTILDLANDLGIMKQACESII